MLADNKSIQLVLLIALAGLVILLVMTRPNQAPVLEEAIVSNVHVAAVSRHDLVPQEAVSGRLEPMRKAALHFEISGQIRQRLVEPGQSVDQGAVLLTLIDDDYRDALVRTEAQLKVEESNIRRDRELLVLAERNRDLQEAEVTRLETLGKESLISQSRLDENRIRMLQLESEVAQLRASTDTATSRLALLRAEHNRATRDLQRTELRAPFAGGVNTVHVQLGDYVTPNQSVLDIIDTSALDLYVEVRGELAQSLSQGQQVDVTVDGRSLEGHIVALQIDPDPVTFTHALRVRLEAKSVRPGMVARVRLPLQALDDVVAVPTTAILQDEGRAYVFRIDDSVLVRTQVMPRQRVGDLQVLDSGVDVGDRVVVRDVAALSDGQQVSVVDED